MACEELRQRWSDNQPADATGHVDLEFAEGSAAALPEQALGLLDIGDDPQAALIEGDAVLRG